ncbi:MAG: hypothetical protein NCW75_02570 [Phycisphaera sp.]|nr:MAG: hypothetical protein NCW75_02570 [Phycisphaera sp.]
MNMVIEATGRLIVAIDTIARINEVLGTLAAEQRGAISKMRSPDVGAIVARQREIGRQLATAEEDRRRETQHLCRALALPEGTSIADLVRAVGTHDRAVGQALGEAAGRAKQAILGCQKEQRVVHAAATGVMAHLDGLARQVLAHMNQAGVYAASGALAGGQTPRGVDCVS